MDESCKCEHFLSVGKDTYQVPVTLFAKNRSRLCEKLKTNSSLPNNSYVLLQGGDNIPLYDTDVDYVFRQESYFMWSFGVLEPGCYGIIGVDNNVSVLFIPRFPEEYSVWMGPLMTTIEYKNKYQVKEVYYVDELEQYLTKMNAGPLLVLNGVNSDSKLEAKGATFEGIEKWKVEKSLLLPAMAELRVIKTGFELDVMRYVTKISSAAHRKVMRMVKPTMNEYQLESAFLDHCYTTGGCRHCSYTCICGTGPNSAILHYGHAAQPNTRELKNGDMCLFDMGANYMGYAADITCSFPSNGKFTPEQKIVYEAVLAANEAVKKACKPGVSWPDMHRLSEKIILEHLKNSGLLTGDVKDMLNADLGYVFMPHGLGHLLGLDVHDVGGYLQQNPPRPTERGLNRLRTARILQEGMCLTVEPGCYFNPTLLDAALANEQQSKFINAQLLNKYLNFGGVRIEDDVIITKNGLEDMTIVPRTVQEIERWMAGLDDDKYT